MMNKHMLTIALTMLTHPVCAAELQNGDVMYCTSDFFYGATPRDSKVHPYVAENFRISLSKTSVKFGSSGYFKDTVMPIEKLKPWAATAQDDDSTFQLHTYNEEISFTYASSNSFAMALMKGSCNKF